MKITREFLDAQIEFKQRARQQTVSMGCAGQYGYEFEQTARDIRVLDTQIAVLRDLRDVLDQPEQEAAS